ncbi:MAG: efflux RND transporter periplasmic adaptor subunit [Pseudomonadota bacterium]
MIRGLFGFFRKFLVVIISIAVVVVPTVGIILLLNANKPQTEKKEVVVTAPRVVVATIAPQAAQLRVETRGEVRPRTEIDLTAQVSGRIQSVSAAFENGGLFKKGDVLVKIEDADYRLAVTRAEASVAQARQLLVQEEAESELARRDWEELGNEGEPSALTLRIPQLNKARADYAAAEADLRVAELNLERTNVRASFDGRVREKRADSGQFVTVGTPLARIFSTDVAQIRLPLTDQELSLLNLPLAFVASKDDPGAEVTLTAPFAGRTREWTGRLVRTDGAIDSQTRQLYAIAEVVDPYGAAAEEAGAPLAVGLFVEAMIAGREIPDALLIPRVALRSGSRIFVADADDKLRIRDVETITIDEETLLVQSGLAAGERLIVSVVRGPTEGMEVEPYDPDAPPRAEEEDEPSVAAAVAEDDEGRL